MVEASEGRPPSRSRTVMSQMVGVADANVLGFAHGGTIMKLVDTTAAVAAMRHSGSRVVTAAVDSLVFRSRVHIGDVVTLVAVVNQTWRTSMEVEVEVYREDPMIGDRELTTTAFATFVAIDEEGRPRPVPPVLPETEEERRRQREAEIRRRHRLELRRALDEGSTG